MNVRGQDPRHAEQTRTDALNEAADMLDHQAMSMPMDAEYEAAIVCRCADDIRGLCPQHTELSSAFLGTHAITAAEHLMIDDMNQRKSWSLNRWMAHWFHRRFR